jgi:hypothetical protein
VLARVTGVEGWEQPSICDRCTGRRRTRSPMKLLLGSALSAASSDTLDRRYIAQRGVASFRKQMVRQRVAPWLRTRADSDELRTHADRGSTS